MSPYVEAQFFIAQQVKAKPLFDFLFSFFFDHVTLILKSGSQENTALGIFWMQPQAWH